MMTFGKVIKKMASSAIELRSFRMDGLGWSANASTAEFVIKEQPFEEGGFRQTYR